MDIKPLALALAFLTAGYAGAAAAGVVTVTAQNKSGSPAEGAVIVFDPLDSVVPPGHDSAIVDQINRKFVPRVSVVRTGTSIAFPNSDAIRHQVYSFSQARPFNLKLYAGAPRVDVLFDKPGLVVLGCNIHDTMVAFVLVVDSPYFAKIPAAGKLVLDLPAGRYRMRVWHPLLAASNAPPSITVGAGAVAIPLIVDLDPYLAATAAWPE